jgi:glutamine amidotransferase
VTSVALIDYGSGNLRSAEKALQKVAAGLARPVAIRTTDDPDLVASADLIVLPGVGAFAACMDALAARTGVIEAMTHAVKGRGVPFFGICVGMQLLASRGLEFGETPGLDWLAGDVKRIEPKDRSFKVPHMGWNVLEGRLPGALFHGLPPGPHVYFTHSFAFYPSAEDDIAALVDHGGRFPAAVMRGNVAGVQFHPEKSQSVGARLLSNVLEWRP